MSDNEVMSILRGSSSSTVPILQPKTRVGGLHSIWRHNWVILISHESARFLFEHGANIASQDQYGLTPLHEASEQGHIDIARFLVEHGANVAV